MNNPPVSAPVQVAAHQAGAAAGVQAAAEGASGAEIKAEAANAAQGVLDGAGVSNVSITPLISNSLMQTPVATPTVMNRPKGVPLTDPGTWTPLPVNNSGVQRYLNPNTGKKVTGTTKTQMKKRYNQYMTGM